MKTTINEWLSELPEPYKHKAQVNRFKAPLTHKAVFSLSDALNNAFDWGRSPEGNFYWSELHKKIIKDEKNS